jgi:hypothetical protein
MLSHYCLLGAHERQLAVGFIVTSLDVYVDIIGSWKKFYACYVLQFS